MTVAELAATFATVGHVWEGLGVHTYEPGAQLDCPVCEALDAILVDSKHEKEQAALHQFWSEGMVFLANLAVFHPRGFALTVHVDDDGRATRLSVQGDGYEPWVFARGDVDESLTQVLEGDSVREREWHVRQ